MTTKDLDATRALFLRVYKKMPDAQDLLDAWEAMPDKPGYRDFVKMTFLLRQGHNPIPDVDRYETLMRAAGHEFAAADVLDGFTYLAKIFGRDIFRQQYLALHGTLAARLLRGPYIFSEADLEVLYSTLDRLLHGSKAWTTVERVPAADRSLYQRLRDVRIPYLFTATVMLDETILDRGVELFGPGYREVNLVSLPAQYFLTAAATIRNGRQKATLEDAFEAAWIYLSLFDTDLRSLPPVIREGARDTRTLANILKGTREVKYDKRGALGPRGVHVRVQEDARCPGLVGRMGKHA